MAGEPKKDNRQGYLKEFFLANPTVVLSLLYLYVTAIGMLYSAVLYRNFGITIFDYSEIGDFLLAAFKNPIAFLSGGLFAAMGAAVVPWMTHELRSWDNTSFGYAAPEAGLTEEEEKAYREAQTESIELEREEIKRTVRRRMVMLAISLILVGIFSSLILPYYSATRTASSIKDGETPTVDVRYRSFKGSEGQVTAPDLALIGATQKAVFFYDVNVKDIEKDNRTLVIPQAQIVSIERSQSREVTTFSVCGLPRILYIRIPTA